jgi:spermidine/putrescine transport system substrate-binding protein
VEPAEEVMMPHPRERREPPGPVTRREFIRRSAGTALALSGASAFLAACGKGTPAASGSSSFHLPLARPDHPVRWPIFPDNKAIASGLQPEQNATLKLFNWSAYIYKKVLNDFEKKFKRLNVTVQVSTFNNMDEALSKIRSGEVDFDVFFPTVDVLGKLVELKFLRPLNHSYLPNLDNVWKELQNPFYDRGSQYTVPYVAYTTGVAWRTDMVKEDLSARPMPYDVFFDSQFKGTTEVLDDYRETMSMMLLKNGIFDVNTGDPKHLSLVRSELIKMAKATNPLVNVRDYVDLPDGKVGITEAWSGDMVNAQYYGPKGFDPGVLRYWYLPRHAPVNNDTIAILRSGKNPVLSHLFLNFMLDFGNAMENFSWVGYQPPQRAINADLLVKQQLIPPNLKSAVVPESIWATGARELELSPSVDASWHDVWSQFKAGA